MREFACRDGSDRILIHPDLPLLLEAVRKFFRAPVHITSGYRTEDWNTRVGGKTNSFHLRGMAADIAVVGKTPLEIYRAIDNGLIKGINPQQIGMGLYTRQGFVHLDVRGWRARW